MVRQSSCSVCGEKLVQASKGRARRYCSDACRVRSQRIRKAGDLPTDRFIPVELKHAEPIVLSGPDEKQVERALLEARTIAFAFLRLSREVHPALAWRCQKIGEAILASLEETIGKETVS
jgi:hypothetical protein